MVVSWWASVLLVVVFGAFILFVPFYRKADRRPAGAFLAFITVFALHPPESSGTAGYYIYLACILAGGILIVGGWARVSRDYWSRDENAGRLVREGLYRYIRHPQYTGFLLIPIGMLFKRVSILLLILWPVLAVQYHRLARREEKELEEQFGSDWHEYRTATGMYLPRFMKKRRD